MAVRPGAQQRCAILRSLSGVLATSSTKSLPNGSGWLSINRLGSRTKGLRSDSQHPIALHALPYGTSSGIVAERGSFVVAV